MPVTSFKMAPDASTPIHTKRDLEHRLRRRLRVVSAIVAGTIGGLALVALVVRRAEWGATPLRIFTAPPLPGVMLVLALCALAAFVALAPNRDLSIDTLRKLEWSGVAAAGLFFVLNQTLALPYIAPRFFGNPMEAGVAQGAPWGVLIVAYGVLVPSSMRHALLRTGLVIAAAFIPDVLVLPRVADPLVGVSSYLAVKLVIVGVMSALAIYGSYRIEELGQEAEVARELGQYLLRKSLGEGGMGSVYLAEHRFLRRPCAVKFIRADQAGSEVALARFEREVQSVATLTHPNTVQIYDYGRSEDGLFYFAMEFLPGISLEELVKQHGPLPPSRAVHILVQLCGALQEAHGLGLVHRDIKPANVMLCERGGVADVAKLLDFGLVTSVKDDPDSKLTQPGMAVGTPDFMSPEQCDGENIGPASDIYSIGALGYFLLTGHGLFPGKSVMQTFIAHLHDIPRPLKEVRPDVPQALSDAIAKCVNKKPEDRFPDAASLAAALVSSLGNSAWSISDAKSWWSTPGRIAPSATLS